MENLEGCLAEALCTNESGDLLQDADALAHVREIASEEELLDRLREGEALEKICQCLPEASASNNLASAFISSNLGIRIKQRDQLQQLFKLVDTDNSGLVELEELIDFVNSNEGGSILMGGMAVTEVEIRKMMDAHDVDGNKSLDRYEFADFLFS